MASAQIREAALYDSAGKKMDVPYELSDDRREIKFAGDLSDVAYFGVLYDDDSVRFAPNHYSSQRPS